MPRKLREIDVAEVSLVDAAANRKKFAILKRRQDMKELLDILKSFLGEAFSGVEEILKAAGEMPEDAAKSLKMAVGLLDKYKGDFPDDILKAIQVLAKYASYGYPAKKSADGAADLDFEKVGARLSKATLEEIKKLRDILVKTLGETAALKKAKEIVETLIGMADVEKKDRYAGLPEDAVARLKKLDEIEAAEQDNIRKAADTERTELKDTIKKLTERLDTLEKTKGVKKSKDGQDTDEDKDKEADKKDLWPSLGRSRESAD